MFPRVIYFLFHKSSGGMVVGSSLTYSCQLDRKLFFYFILTLFYPTEELPQENYPPPLARSPSLSAKAHRDDKASQHRNFILNRQRSSEICHLPFPICNYNSDIPSARYILCMRYISQAKCIYNRQRSSEICHFPFSIFN